MKKALIVLCIFLALVLGIRIGAWMWGGPPTESYIGLPQAIERAPLEHGESLVVVDCVPIESVVPKGVVAPAKRSGLKTPPAALNDPSNELFPLRLGTLEIPFSPYGGKLDAELVDNGAGVGKIHGNFTPNEAPDFEWLFDTSAGFGLGQSARFGIMVEPDIRVEIFRRKKWTLEAELRASVLQDGTSDLQVLAKVRRRFGE